MKKKWLKKSTTVLLTTAMILSLFPGMKGTLVTVQAAENNAPTSEYWTDADELKGFSLDGKADTVRKIQFGLNEGQEREWAICGVDDTDGSLVLLSTSTFGTATYGRTGEYSKSNFVADISKYVNENNNSSVYLGTDYFSLGETGKMENVTVSTTETDGGESVPVESKKLYLPYSQDNYLDDLDNNIIRVGSSNNIAIDVTKLNKVVFEERFWLRSPFFQNIELTLEAHLGQDIRISSVFEDNRVVPAMNLNLSSVLFASAANAASPSYRGYKANGNMSKNIYTLRYTSKGAEAAVISEDGTKVTVTGASGKYLMVQNSTGVYIMQINSDNQTVSASDIRMGDDEADILDNFDNCKVWLESTDSDRITTAKLATTAINSVAVTDITAPEAGSALDTDAACVTTGVTSTTPTVTWKQGGETVTGNAGYNTTYTASVTLTADDGYEFTADTTATVDGNAATVVYNSNEGTLTVTYTYTATEEEAATYTVRVTSKAMDGKEVTAALSGGASGLEEDASITVSAPAVDPAAYKFLGWYKADSNVTCGYSGECLSNERSYTFNIKEDTSLVAVYKAMGQVSIDFNGGKSQYTVNGDIAGSATTKSITVGTQVTVAVSDVANFDYWKNAAGVIVSKNTSYTFTATIKDSLTAVFKTPAEGNMIVIWETDSGQVLQREEYNADGLTGAQAPSLPVRYGYNVTGWDKAVTGLTFEAGKMVTIKPVSEKMVQNYQISITGGTLDKVDGIYNVSDVATATANAPEKGQKFSHWIDRENNIVSYSSTYPFYVTKEVSLTAVYVDDAESVTAKGTAEIIQTTYDAAKKYLSFVSMLTVPDGASIDYAGMVATTDSSVTTDLTKSNAAYVRGVANPGTQTQRVTWTKLEVENDAVWYVRAYLVYTTSLGETIELYGDFETITAEAK